MLISLLLHALGLAWSWKEAAPTPRFVQARPVWVAHWVRMPAASPRPPLVSAATPQVLHVPKAAPAVPPRTKKRPPPALPLKEAASLDSPSHPPTAVAGSVFGIPRMPVPFAISNGLSSRSAPVQQAALQAMPPHQEREGRREQMKQQLAGHLEHLRQQWEAPLGEDAGECQVITPSVALACSTPALQSALAAFGDALANVVRTWHSLDEQVAGVAIVFQEGRYRIALSTLPVNAK